MTFAFCWLAKRGLGCGVLCAICSTEEDAGMLAWGPTLVREADKGETGGMGGNQRRVEWRDLCLTKMSRGHKVTPSPGLHLPRRHSQSPALCRLPSIY